MKAQTKALVASLIIVALGLSAVSGVTYSWWSDSENTDVSITTGSLRVDTEVLSIADGDGNPIALSTITAGGSIPTTLDFPGYQPQGDSNDLVIKYRALFYNTIGAKGFIGFNVAHIPSGSTVTMGVVKESSEGPSSANTTFMISAGDGTNPSATVEVTLTITEIQMGSTYQITIKNEIHQKNSTSAPTSQVVVFGAENLLQTPTTTEGVGATVSFVAGDDAETFGTDVSIKSVGEAEAAENSYSFVNSGNVVGGVQVTATNSGQKVDNYLSGQSVTIIATLKGNYVNESGNFILSIYHEDIDVTSVVSDTVASYDNTTGITTVSFKTTQGFSSYFFVQGIFFSEGKFYFDLGEAFKGANGSEVELLKNAKLDSDRDFSGNNVIMNLNLMGFTLKLIGDDNGVTENIKIKNGTIDVTSGYLDFRLGNGYAGVAECKNVNFSNVKFYVDGNVASVPSGGPCADYSKRAMQFITQGTSGKMIAAFDHCEFINSTILFNPLSETNIEIETVFNSCVFEKVGCYDLIEMQNGNVFGEISIKDCSFTITPTGTISIVDPRSAVDDKTMSVKFEGTNKLNALQPGIIKNNKPSITICERYASVIITGLETVSILGDESLIDKGE